MVVTARLSGLVFAWLARFSSARGAVGVPRPHRPPEKSKRPAPNLGFGETQFRRTERTPLLPERGSVGKKSYRDNGLPRIKKAQPCRGPAARLGLCCVKRYECKRLVTTIDWDLRYLVVDHFVEGLASTTAFRRASGLRTVVQLRKNTDQIPHRVRHLWPMRFA